MRKVLRPSVVFIPESMNFLQKKAKSVHFLSRKLFLKEKMIILHITFVLNQSSTFLNYSSSLL